MSITVSPGLQAEVAVIGGGVSGLVTALMLKRAGVDAVVLERDNRIGGRLKSMRVGDCNFDVGVVGLLGSYDETAQLIRELGLGARLTKPAVKMAVIRDGQRMALDLATPIRAVWNTRLLSGAAKLRMARLAPKLLGWWGRLKFDGMQPLASVDSESIGAFAKRELNDEILEYLIGPIIRTVWQREPEDAPLVDLMWTLKHFAPRMYAVDRQLQAFTDALGTQVRVLLNTGVRSVREDAQGVMIEVEREGGVSTQRYAQAVIALPPTQFATLLQPRPQLLMDALQRLPYGCSVSVHLAVKQALGDDLQMLLPPRSLAPDLTTVVFEHNKSPGRAPKGMSAITLLFRDSWSRPRLEVADADVLRDALAQLTLVLPELDASRIQAQHVQRWPIACMSKDVGACGAIQAVVDETERYRRIAFAGDYWALSGVNTAVVSAQRAACKVIARRSNQQSAPAPARP